jgi:hypothetical protein
MCSEVELGRADWRAIFGLRQTLSGKMADDPISFQAPEFSVLFYQEVNRVAKFRAFLSVQPFLPM